MSANSPPKKGESLDEVAGESFRQKLSERRLSRPASVQILDVRDDVREEHGERAPDPEEDPRARARLRTTARFLCEVRPALDFESLIETMFTLRLPFPPACLQRAALAVAARSDGYSAFNPTAA